MTSSQAAWCGWEMYLNDKKRSEIWGMDGLSDEQAVKLLRGEPIGRPVPSVRLSKRTPGELPDLVTAPVEWVVSQPLHDVLADSGANVEFLPVKVERTRQPFWLANPLDKVKAVDEAKSKIERSPEGRYRKIEKLVLLPLPASTPALVRLAEKPMLALVRQELRRAMEAACQAPGRFIPIDELTWG